MNTIAILNQKGGVGKTTTAVTLAHGLAMSGYRTLLVDLDPQGNVADSLGIDKGGMLYALLVDGWVEPVSSGRENLDVILSDKTTVEAKTILAGRPFREMALKQALDELSGQYDVCVLDTAPGADVLQVAAFVAADKFLIPVSLSHLAVVGASDALATAASLRQVGGFAGDFLGVLPTLWERSTSESHTQLEVLARSFASLVYPPIPQDTKAREAAAHGQTLWEYAPKSRALQGVSVKGNDVGGYLQVLARLTDEVQ